MSDEPPKKRLFKQRAMGFGKRRTEARTTAPKLTTEIRPLKTVAQNQIQVSMTRNEPAFTIPDVTCRLVAKDLYQYRQVGATKNWEDTLFTKSFIVVFHKALESLPLPEQGYAICLMDLAARSYGDLGSYDKFLGGQIRHKDFDHPICLPFLPITQFHDKIILDELKFLRSQDRFPAAISSNEFEIDFYFVRKLAGSGLARKRSLEKDIKGLTPNNVSKFCLPVAILQGICWLDYSKNKDDKNEEKWKAIKKVTDKDPEYKELKEKIDSLLRLSGLVEKGVLKDRNYTIDDVKKIQTVYADQYQIVVFAEADNKKPVYCGPSLMGRSILPLVCKDDHYQHINNLSQFVNHKYYCVDCKVGYGTLLAHYNCPLRCRLCNRWGCQREDDVEITCDDCKVTFYSVKCEQNHREYLEAGSKTTICGSTLYCNQCDTTYRKQKQHKCNHNYCQHCRVFRPQGHLCTMSVKNKAGIQGVPQKFIFVRVKYEEVLDEAGKPTQRALLAMALRCCRDCRDELEAKIEQGANLTCDKCSHGGNRLWFSNSFKEDVDVLTELTSFLISKEHEKYCIAFHDIPDCVNEHFLKYITTDGSLKARHFIMTEGRLRSVQFDGLKVKIVDSKYLFPVSLRKMAQSTDALLPFRYLPQSLITRENISFVGLVPPLEVFLEGVEDEEEQQLINKYHKKLTKHPYDMTSEILNCTYYELLLLAGSVRNIDAASFDLLGVRLVEEVRDLPSGSLLAYQRSYLPDAVLPLDVGAGSRFNNSSSHSAREYLAWRGHDEQLPIDSSFNVGEYRIKGTPYYVDGFIQPCDKYPRGLAIEIHGCYWHAHGCSYVPKMVARRELDVPRIKEQDKKKKAYVEELHEFEIIWECEIALLRKRPEVMEFMQNWEYEGPVEILAAIYPPRSEVFSHFAEATEDYDLRICDITSLMAKILQEGEYPDVLVTRLHGQHIKVPIRTAEELRSQVKGIVYCEVLAPSSLMFPVLPDNVNDKIAYYLCRACFECETEICDHEEEYRIQKGTWTTFELELALEQGYVITRVIGAIHCDKWSKYRVEDGEEKHSIFSEYATVLRSLQKLGCEETDETKEPSEMVKHTTQGFLRLPERFGRRSDHPATQTATTPTELWKLLENPMTLVKEIKPTKQNKLIISSGDRATVVDAAGERRTGAKPLDTTVTLVPALVGGQLRVELYKAISQEDCHCLYLDDSHLVYLCPKGSDPLASIGKDVYSTVKLSKYWSNGAGHFVVETEDKDLIMKTPGLTRKGAAFYARAEAIKKQTELLIEGRPECVEIEHVAITHDTYNILTNTTANRLVHTTSPFSRFIQPEGSTLPKGFLW